MKKKPPSMPMNGWKRQMQQVIAMISVAVSVDLGIFKDGVEVSLSTAGRIYNEFKNRKWIVSDEVVFSKKDPSFGINFQNLGSTVQMKFFGEEVEQEI